MPRQHPLVAHLQGLRERHKMSQRKVERCMEITDDTLRHVEKGRRPLPRLEQGLAAWVNRFLQCIDATPEERKEVIELMSRQILLELSELLDDTDGQ